MDNLSLEEKIAFLRKKHKDPAALAQINDWESRLGRIQFDKDWLNHPNTNQLKEISIEEIERIDQILSNTRGLPEIERESLFAAKEAHMRYLDTLTGNLEEAKTIERQVDYEMRNPGL